MANKKSNNSTASFRERFARMTPQKQRRFLLKSGGAAALVVASAGALATYDKRQRTLHDLSDIGAGRATVVQIHDPSCPVCRNLKSRTSKALEQFDAVDFRLADITTPEGRKLQEQHRAEKITLLLFDAKGKHLQTVVGLQSVEQLSELFKGVFKS